VVGLASNRTEVVNRTAPELQPGRWSGSGRVKCRPTLSRTAGMVGKCDGAPPDVAAEKKQAEWVTAMERVRQAEKNRAICSQFRREATARLDEMTRHEEEAESRAHEAWGDLRVLLLPADELSKSCEKAVTTPQGV
jgi:hypothetical protein